MRNGNISWAKPPPAETEAEEFSKIFALGGLRGSAVALRNIAEPVNARQVSLHFLLRPLFPFSAAFQFNRFQEKARSKPVGAVEPAILKKQNVADLLLIRLFPKKLLTQPLPKGALIQLGIARVFTIRDAIDARRQFVQGHFTVAQPFEVKRLLP